MFLTLPAPPLSEHRAGFHRVRRICLNTGPVEREMVGAHYSKHLPKTQDSQTAQWLILETFVENNPAMRSLTWWLHNVRNIRLNHKAAKAKARSIRQIPDLQCKNTPAMKYGYTAFRSRHPSKIDRFLKIGRAIETGDPRFGPFP